MIILFGFPLNMIFGGKNDERRRMKREYMEKTVVV
jgi:hypothetical protein